MTDHFEKATQRILREARANGGVTTDHILDALIATNEDLDAQHKETSGWHQTVTEMVEDHIEEAKVRDDRLKKLEDWQHTSMTTCEERVRHLAREEHHAYHGEYVASLGDSTFQSRLLWFFATTAGKILLVVIGLVAGMFLNFIVYGRP
jgi:hypothetical protein